MSEVYEELVVRALIYRHMDKGTDRRVVLFQANVAYLGRAGTGLEGSRPDFFDRASDDLQPLKWSAVWNMICIISASPSRRSMAIGSPI